MWAKIQHNPGRSTDAITHRCFPTTLIFIIGVCSSSREEVAPLWDVFFSLLSPDLYLLLFATTSEIILLETTLILVRWFDARLWARCYRRTDGITYFRGDAAWYGTPWLIVVRWVDSSSGRMQMVAVKFRKKVRFRSFSRYLSSPVTSRIWTATSSPKQVIDASYHSSEKLSTQLTRISHERERKWNIWLTINR